MRPVIRLRVFSRRRIKVGLVRKERHVSERESVLTRGRTTRERVINEHPLEYGVSSPSP